MTRLTRSLFSSSHSTRLNPFFLSLGLFLVGLMSLGAQAQSYDVSNNTLSAFPAESPVTLSVQSRSDQIGLGTKSVLAVILDHAEHFHTNLNDPIVPKEMGSLVPIPTTIEVPEIAGITFGAIVWPEPVEVDIDFFMTGKPFKYLVFSEQTIIYIPFEVAADAEIGDRSIDLVVGYQACNETACFPPERETLTISLGVVEEVSPVILDKTDSKVQTKALPIVDNHEGMQVELEHSELIETERSAIFDGFDSEAEIIAPVVLSNQEGAKIERKFLGLFVMPAPDSFAGVVVLALSAAIGGFILNLTPCVLPVIPIKVMTISSHAGESKSKAFMLSMWMAIGVIAFWVGIGIPVAFVSKFTDPSIIFGIWWITGIIGVVIAVMSFGIMGLFQIKLPQQVYMVNPKADTVSGSFVFGIMTAVLGLPCFGFVAGALLAGAATMPSILVLTVFLFMGIGMAMPYVVLAMFPKLIDKLPRTGPASELIKHVMGLLMLAAAAYFLGTSVISFGSGNEWVFPWWGKTIHWWAIGLVGVATGGWLIFQTFKITKRVGPRMTYTVLGLAFALIGSFVAYNQTMHQYHYFWQPFSPEFLATSLENDKVVVLDFTAEWCLNCKALEASVLSRNPVKGHLLSSDVIPMVADLTSTTAPGWQQLSDLGQTGIPLLAVYAPGIEEPIWLSNSYTPSQVVDAIEEARRRGISVSLAD